jgi:alkanesulfonate monooxygenase SsuD/methylene tetrahydromethanopterin reductase-like flavin-dependent oxidoreductase (luciferase family)
MLRLTAQYADLWNVGYMGEPETLAAPRAKLEAACPKAGRDPATIGITVFIGLWFSDLQETRPNAFETP